MNRTNFEQKNSETEKEICVENTKNKQNVSSEKKPVIMKLVIAEKPSVARSISEVIGATKVCDGYMEGNGYVVSWCVGHLVELAQPESYGEQWKKWTYESLPVKPEKWQYEVKPDTKAQYDVLCQLMHREDVSAAICATDVG